MPHARARRPLPRFRPLKEQWEAAGAKQEDVANALGLKPETLSRWLLGRRAAPPDLAARIEAAIPRAAEIRKQILRNQLEALES